MQRGNKRTYVPNNRVNNVLSLLIVNARSPSLYVSPVSTSVRLRECTSVSECMFHL